MSAPCWNSGPAERPPRRLAHLGGGGDEPLLDATVAGDRGQNAAPSRVARVNDELAIGRNARALRRIDRFPKQNGRTQI